MHKKIIIILSVIVAVLFFACSKEYSYESGNGLGGYATGSLKDSLGNCQDIAVNGTYTVDSIMTDSNYAIIKLNITSIGKYKINTDTVNGFWFNDSSYVLTSGIQTIKIKAHGKPILPMLTTFTVNFDSTTCMFSVPITSASGLTSNYFPTTANSNWTYINSSSLDTVRVTATNTTYLIGSSSYVKFVDSDNDSAGYRNDGSGNYYAYRFLDASATAAIEYIFLKDNVPIGTTWETPEAVTTFLGAASKIKYKYTIINTGTSLTVNGTTYNNVIKVRLDYYYFVSGAYQATPAYSQYDYYAQGVGLISSETINFSPTIYKSIQRYQVY
ncbi:MAG: hypothetical protein JSR09_02620 [Bacteroidetes bacterium]|nr:hypothetical protein [Bacteroidota bacterium]MBS1648577.1 hypothetical protein [Bacteroidota bacterium]